MPKVEETEKMYFKHLSVYSSFGQTTPFYL